MAILYAGVPKPAAIKGSNKINQQHLQHSDIKIKRGVKKIPEIAKGVNLISFLVHSFQIKRSGFVRTRVFPEVLGRACVPPGNPRSATGARGGGGGAGSQAGRRRGARQAVEAPAPREADVLCPHPGENTSSLPAHKLCAT